jgi:photosystem II stability/assembly factor-like uncharacterized protein
MNIARSRSQKTAIFAAFCVLMAGLIALTGYAGLVSTVSQAAGQSPEISGGRVTMLGPGGGGCIPAIAIAPFPSGDVYVGCDVGGFYQSTNDGESWIIKNNGLWNVDIMAIAVDFRNPGVIYLGTSGGVFKSTDGGESWLSKRNGFPGLEKWSISAPVCALAIDPSNTDVIYAGSGYIRGATGSYEEKYGKGAIYKSLDGGESWFIVNTAPSAIDSSAVIHSIATDPSNTGTLYTATDKGFYKSTDGGTNWAAKNNGLPAYSGETTPDVGWIVVNPQNTGVLYVTVQTKPNTAPWQGGVYMSTDGGESWVAKCNGLDNYAGGPYSHPMQTANYRHLVIDAENPETLFVASRAWGDYGIYKTTDGGDNWVNTTVGSGPEKNMDLGWIEFAGLAVTSFAIDPSNPDRLYFGTGMTLFKTDDGGNSWSQAYTRETTSGTWQSIGMETTCVWDIAIDKTNPDNIYVGYNDIGFLKSANGGNSFKRFEILNPWGGNTFSIAIDPDSPNIIYAGAGQWETNTGRVVKSTDYGETWTFIDSLPDGLPDSRVNSVVIDPTTPVDSRTLYAACWDYGVYKSVDGGQSWVPVNNGIGANRYLYRLVIDPNNPAVLYAGILATGQSPGDYGGIYKTVNGGESWTKANQNIELPNVWDLVMDPSDSSTLFAGTAQHYTQPSGPFRLGGVYKSVDGGENWQAVLADDPPLSIFNINALAISQVNPDLVFAGSVDYGYHDVFPGSGIFVSRDSGETWETMNEGLPSLNIKTLAAHPTNPDILYAGTQGNSVFRIIVPRPPSFSGLTISPGEVETGETVTVSVLVTNNGEIEDTYQVQMMVDGSVEETSEVTLAGGDSQTVTFTTTKDIPGLYTVTIGGLTGMFTVKPDPVTPVIEGEEVVTEPPVTVVEEGPSVPPSTHPQVTPTPAESTNWPLIIGLIGGAVVIIILLVYFLVWRRRTR